MVPEQAGGEWCQSVLKQAVCSDWLGSHPDWDEAAGEIEFLKESLNTTNNITNNGIINLLFARYYSRTFHYIHYYISVSY